MAKKPRPEPPKKPPEESPTPAEPIPRDDARIEQIELDRLMPYARNAKVHTEAQVAEIAASIARFGFNNPVLVRTTVDGKLAEIIAGHGRVLAAHKLGKFAAPCIRLDHLTEIEARAYRLADNRLAEKSAWDDQMLALEFDDLEAADFAIPLTGFSLEDQQQVRARATRAAGDAAGGQEGEDDFGTVPVDPITREGDVWYIGPHRLGCLDVFDGEALKTFVAGATVHCIATDPPYAIYGSATGQSSDIADDRMVRPFFEGVVHLLRDYLPWFGHAYVFCDWRSYPTLAEVSRRVETIERKNLLVWDKGGSGLGSNYANTHELVAFFAKMPKQTAMGHRAAGVRVVHKPNVLRYNRPSGTDREHNAAKPVGLLRELVENSTGPGDLFLEPFCGSGSQMVACDQTARVCYATDIAPKWVDVTIGRMLRLREIEAHLGAPDGPTYKEIAKERAGDTRPPPRNARH